MKLYTLYVHKMQSLVQKLVADLVFFMLIFLNYTEQW